MKKEEIVEILERGSFGSCPQCGAASKGYKGRLVHLVAPWNLFCSLKDE